MFDYDIVVVGGGMVGASLACAMGHLPIRIGIVESAPMQKSQQPGFDDRAIALSLGSKRIFETLGIWKVLKKDATPIKIIHVSDKGHMGMTRLVCEQDNVSAYGYVAAAHQIGHCLNKMLNTFENIHMISPATVKNVEIKDSGAQLEIEIEGTLQTLSCALLVAADGGDSFIRNRLKVKTLSWDYQQSAVITNISTQYPHSHIAFERFTEHGPLAVLPFGDNQCSVVWSRKNSDVKSTMELGNEQFQQALQDQFGYRLGDITRIGKRQAYPLRLVYSKEQLRSRVVFIGNAAHSLHPIAGQGFNLGLRDVAVLTEVLANAIRNRTDLSDKQVLKAYKDWRVQDHLQMLAFTDGLVRLFSNQYLPFVIGRNLGLFATEYIPTLKRLLTKHAMGLGGRQPKLIRGLQV